MIRTRPRVFYGWWIVSTAALGLLLGPVPIVVFSFGVFLRSLTQEFHSGRGAISFAFTLHNLIAAVSAPVVGRLVDRFGARRVILPSAVLVGSILLSSNLWSGRIWQLYVFYLALGLVGSGSNPVPYGTLIAHWFDRHRGLALGLMLFGLGSGALIMPSLAQRLIARFGWRLAYGIVGAAILLISVPVLGMFLKERPEQIGLLPDGAAHVPTATPGEPEDQGVSWHDAGTPGHFGSCCALLFSCRPACRAVSSIWRQCLPIGGTLFRLPPWQVRSSAVDSSSGESAPVTCSIAFSPLASQP